MRPPLAGLAVLAAVAFSACGETTLDAQEQEAFVRAVVVREVGARVAAVRCPQDVERREGDTFRCTVTGRDDSSGEVIVTQQENSKVRVVAPFLHVREAEAVIADGISDQLRADGVDVSCPEIVVVERNRRLSCSAVAGASRRSVAVQLTDDAGRFRFRLR